MSRIEIVLGANRSAAISPEKLRYVLSAEQRQAIFERDDHTCQCCGFRAEKYQDILFKNGNPQNTSEQNLATVCGFCYQCFYLDQAALMRSGILIWFPEVPQHILNHLARSLYIGRISQGESAETSKHLLDIFLKRRDDCKKRIGTDSPFVAAQILRDYVTPRVYDFRQAKLKGVRLFPLDRKIIKEADIEFNQFPQILAYWRSKDGPFGGKIPSQWKKFYAEISQAA